MNKEKIANVVASLSIKIAEKACGSASIFGVHQIKESKEVQEFFAKK